MYRSIVKEALKKRRASCWGYGVSPKSLCPRMGVRGLITVRGVS